MKKHKGEIATLLTLGLVILGGILAIGSSVFLSQQKTTSTKAATTCQDGGMCGSGPGAYKCDSSNPNNGCNPSLCDTQNLEFACCVKDNFSCNGGPRYRWYGCTGQPCENTKISNSYGHLFGCPAGIIKDNKEQICEAALTPGPATVPCAQVNGICVAAAKCSDGTGYARPPGGWSDCGAGNTCCEKSGVIVDKPPEVTASPCETVKCSVANPGTTGEFAKRTFSNSNSSLTKFYLDNDKCNLDTGGANPNVGSTSREEDIITQICVAPPALTCGHQGEPICPTGSKCFNGLTPWSDPSGKRICTENCEPSHGICMWGPIDASTPQLKYICKGINYCVAAGEFAIRIGECVVEYDCDPNVSGLGSSKVSCISEVANGVPRSSDNTIVSCSQCTWKLFSRVMCCWSCK